MRKYDIRFVLSAQLLDNDGAGLACEDDIVYYYVKDEGIVFFWDNEKEEVRETDYKQEEVDRAIESGKWIKIEG